MAEPHEQLVDDVRAFIRAGERLAEGVMALNAMNAEALDDLRRGMSLTESVTRRDSAAWSRRVTSLLDEFEAARRAVRASTTTVLLDEGRSIADVARAFGVSHQLAGRFARPPRDGVDGAAPAGAD